MPRVVLLVPAATYRAADFVAAARALGVELVVASDEEPVLDGGMAIPLDDPERAVAAIEAVDARVGVDAVVAVDDRGAVAAAAAGERLGFPHSAPDAVAATRDKAEMRRRLATAEVPQPAFGEGVGFPCVVKPTGLSASRGVIRCDTPAELDAARARITAFWDGPLLVEEYVPGEEVAVEALLRGGCLEVLAAFDKPDPLTGPYFEETIYVTPSRLTAPARAAVLGAVERAVGALGLREGPVHAEVRVDGDRVWVIEVAARSIGGLCARTLRFGAGISLEELILRHALGLPLDDVGREGAAAGVMMLPVPSAGVLREVRGTDAARAVPGIVGLELIIPAGKPVTPVPDGDRYLGFLFARGEEPSEVEAALRVAFAHLDIVVS